MIDDLQTADVLDISLVNSKIDEYFDSIWDLSTRQQFTAKVINSSYLLYQFGDESSANILYSLLFNETQRKNVFYEIVRKSVYEYFLQVRQNLKEVKFSTNIFRLKKDCCCPKFDLKVVDKLIDSIEKSWVDNG